MTHSDDDFRKGHDKRSLRDAMGCFATGVTIVTTTEDKDGRKPHGITANSFTSVSLEPPLILVCIDKKSGSFEYFKNTEFFTINILSSEQKDFSEIFAKRGIDKFSHLSPSDWYYGENNCPIIKNTVASLECSTHNIADGGDHIILMGLIKRAVIENFDNPLLFYKGKYYKHQI